MSTIGQRRPEKTASDAISRPGRTSAHSSPAIAVVMDFVGASPPQVDQFLEAMRLAPTGPGLPGSLFQWSRSTLDGVRTTEVWQSRDAFELVLANQLNDHLAAAQLPNPEISIYEVHSYLTQGPPAPPQGEPQIGRGTAP